MHPYLIEDAFASHTAWLRRCQFVQRRTDYLVVDIVPRRPLADEEIATLRSSLEATVPRDVRVEMRLVSDIPPGPNGKFRPYRALVSEASTTGPGSRAG